MTRWAATATLLLAALPAAAQLRLPGSLPQLPNLPERPIERVQRTTTDTVDAAGDTATQTLRNARRTAQQQLLRDQAQRLEADPAGAPVRRGELLLLDPAPALLQAARAEGYATLRDTPLEGLGLRQVVLAPPAGTPLAAALARLRALDPLLVADYHHLYAPSGVLPARAAGAAGTTGAATAANPGGPRIGLVDGGIDDSHAALRGHVAQRWGCAGQPAPPSPHGTAVASLLAGRDGAFSGAQPGAAIWAADVYCGAADGGGVEAVVQALAWLARERVGVITISLVGPANLLLERAVSVLVARGHLLVAAVGNDGPAAPPLYPAAYAGVVGVSAVGPRRQVLPEAAQGAHVAFVAPGAELAVAQPGGGYRVARGTSFAAPLVAGLLATALPAPDVSARQRALEGLRLVARDLGAPGPDTVFGHGLVAEELRVAPDRVRAAAR